MRIEPNNDLRIKGQQTMDAAAANGSNHIVLMGPRSPVIKSVTCLNELH
jgi:hypothetical protein